MAAEGTAKGKKDGGVRGREQRRGNGAGLVEEGGPGPVP